MELGQITDELNNFVTELNSAGNINYNEFRMKSGCPESVDDYYEWSMFARRTEDQGNLLTLIEYYPEENVFRGFCIPGCFELADIHQVKELIRRRLR